MIALILCPTVLMSYTFEIVLSNNVDVEPLLIYLERWSLIILSYVKLTVMVYLLIVFFGLKQAYDY